MKRFLSLILVMLMLTGILTACGGQTDNSPAEEDRTLSEEVPQDTQQNVKSETLILPWSAADSLNPYKSESLMNENIAKLLYDGLFRLDETYSPVKVLAEECVNEKGYLTVSISDKAVFSDGKSVSSSDVVYSFNKAKESAFYSSQLENLSSATAIDGDTVRFKLEEKDIYAENCLTFPIIRYGQGEEANPSGTGRYTFDEGKLKYNKNHISGEKAAIRTVELYDIKDNTGDANALQIGNISFMYSDLSDCRTERITAITRTVELNNLVFLGMNGNKSSLLSDRSLRKIIAYAIDKQDIAENAFQGYARVAETPFNPAWSVMKETEVKTVTYSPLELTQQLDKNGYVYANDTDTVRKKDGKALKLSLLVNKNNDFRINTADFIRTKLKAIGIEAVIEEVSGKELRKAIRKGKFDMYIGEIKLSENMSLSGFFSETSVTGTAKNAVCADAYKAMTSGETDAAAFINTFNEDMPFVPLCYRLGYMAVSNEFEDNIKANPNDVFENIYQWKFR